MVELDSKARSTLRFPPVVGKAKELNNGDVAGKVKDVALFPVYQWFSVPLHSRPIRVRIFISCIFLAFLAFALFTYPMTGVHPALKPTFLMRPNEAVSFPAVDFTNRRQLNETLLAFAQIDLGEAEERRQITNILDGTWAGSSMTRYTSLRDRFGDRFGTDPYDHFEDRRGRPSRLRERLPIQLTSPRYSPFWPQFRRSLQRWVQVKRYEPQIMKHLLQLVKDPVDRHYRSKGGLNVDPGKPYKTCAVVGNSGILLNQSYASRIDSHDMVMRLNNAKTAGFENRVGSKTTLAFVNSNILHSCSRRSRCFCHPYGDEVPMIMYICQVVHFMDMALCAPSHKAPIIVTDPRFDALCARIVKYYSLRNFVESTGRRPEDWSDSHDGPMFHYSSGMQAIVLALGICEKVTIFGFGKSSSARHHYHTNQKAELHLHDYAAEYQFYHDLVHQRSTVIPFLNDAGFVIPPVEVYW